MKLAITNPLMFLRLSAGLRIWMPQPLSSRSDVYYWPDALGWLYLAKAGVTEQSKAQGKGDEIKLNRRAQVALASALRVLEKCPIIGNII
jgi:hypothetical protein